MKWRAWYDDGGVYNSAEHAWNDLPDDGFLVRMLYYPDGTKQIQHGVDYYYEAPHKSGETIYGCGMDYDDIFARYPDAAVKRGRWAPDSFYKHTCNMAHKAEAP